MESEIYVFGVGSKRKQKQNQNIYINHCKSKKIVNLTGLGGQRLKHVRVYRSIFGDRYTDF